MTTKAEKKVIAVAETPNPPSEKQPMTLDDLSRPSACIARGDLVAILRIASVTAEALGGPYPEWIEILEQAVFQSFSEKVEKIRLDLVREIQMCTMQEMYAMTSVLAEMRRK